MVFELCEDAELFVSRFPLPDNVPASFQLEEFFLWYDAVRIERGHHLARSVWLCGDRLQNLKTLALDFAFQLEPGSLATIVEATPHLENFRGIAEEWPWRGVYGISPSELPAISAWSQLRTCLIAVDLYEEDLFTIPPDLGPSMEWMGLDEAGLDFVEDTVRARRKFVQLKDTAVVPRLVNDWREKLSRLETIDVVSRFATVDNGKIRFYERLGFEFNDLDGPISRHLAHFPVIFGCRCDCGDVHFWTDAESASAKCLGFLEPAE